MRNNLTKKEIINSIYMQIGYSKKITENLLEEFFELILNNLIKHKKVKISKFGTFSIKEKKPRIGRNPKTKKEVLISARKVLIFKSSKELQKIVKLNGK